MIDDHHLITSHMVYFEVLCWIGPVSPMLFFECYSELLQHAATDCGSKCSGGGVIWVDHGGDGRGWSGSDEMYHLNQYIGKIFVSLIAHDC